MNIFSAIAGSVLILFILFEGFETVMLPHMVARRFRLTRFFYAATWRAWSFAVCGAFAPGRRRETLLGLYGPLSLIFLLCLWASVLISGFMLLYYSFKAGDFKGFFPTANAGFPGLLYYSGTTFFTLGLSDILPVSAAAKAVTVLEAGTGFGFLAVFISYLPPLNQFFYSRETPVSALSARAGVPVAASGILDRHIIGQVHIAGQNLEVLHQLLYDWEKWAAQLHESHLSYPVLAYFRSQHGTDQSWLTALAAIMDTCAFVIAGTEGACRCQAELTFSMSMHAITDLSEVLNCPPEDEIPSGRLTMKDLERLRLLLLEKGFSGLPGPDELYGRLAPLCAKYEPYVQALAGRFHMAVPQWVRPEGQV